LRSISVLMAMVEPVDQLVDCGRVDVALVDAVDDSLHQIGRRGQALRLDEPTRPVVETDQVGKGPADIYRNEDHASAFLGDGLTMAMDARD
jgi:hypothetical protein